MRIVLASLAFVAFAGPVAAQDQPQAPDVLNQVYACRDIADQAQRLACYDGAVGRLQEAQNTGNLVAVDRGQAQEMDREAFGFSLPSLSRIFGGGGGGGNDNASASTPQFERVDNIAMQIASVTHRRNLPSTFRMTNGQVWVQIDDEVARNVREGGSVLIERASFGSYLMRVEAGGPAIRVRRTQ